MRIVTSYTSSDAATSVNIIFSGSPSGKIIHLKELAHQFMLTCRRENTSFANISIDYKTYSIPTTTTTTTTTTPRQMSRGSTSYTKI